MSLSITKAALRIGVPEVVLRQWVWNDYHRVSYGAESVGPPWDGSYLSPSFDQDKLDRWMLANMTALGDLH